MKVYILGHIDDAALLEWGKSNLHTLRIYATLELAEAAATKMKEAYAKRLFTVANDIDKMGLRDFSSFRLNLSYPDITITEVNVHDE